MAVPEGGRDRRTAPARFAVTVDGRARRVHLGAPADGEDAGGTDGDTVIARVDDREYRLDARFAGDGVILLVDGTTNRVAQVDGTAPKLSVEISHPDGESRQLVLQVAADDARAAVGSGGGAATGPVTLRAPIPGKVVKLLVRAGDAVAVGQALLVLEAMKMENELRAPRAGVAATVHVAEGSNVESGQELISIG